jgi:Porin subfamily
MKMVKSLLLGSAAGLVAVSAGQAADLPVKAKPVEYVKVCTLYGDGFYYIPGTQTCIKIGGFLRTEWDANAGGSFTPFFSSNGLQTRGNDTLTTRARGVVTFDVREQSSFGTLRAYIAGGWQQTSNDNPTLSLPGNTAAATGGGAATPVGGNNSSTYLLRAFIQWGGFTFGKTASFYDFFNTSKYSHQTEFLYKDYAGDGVTTYGYTQQLGNGLAATIAVQDYTPFGHPVLDVSRVAVSGAGVSTFVGDNPFQIGAGGPTNSGNTNAGFLVPDIVGSIRVDQTWGGAQVAAILHDNRSNAYLNPVNGIIDTTAHPSDQWGFAVQGGFELNLANWGWAKGDSFAVQSQYCVGDSESCINNSGTRLSDLFWGRRNGNSIGLAWVDDAYFNNNGTAAAPGAQNSLQLPTVWNVYAAVQHYWMPELRTSLYGGYAQYQANSSAVDQSFCAPLHAGKTLTTVAGGGTIIGNSGVSASGCADWTTWTIGSRTIWNPTRNLDIGVDVLYSELTKSAFEGATFVFTPAQSPTERLTAGSAHIVAGIVRVQYNFYP